MRFSVKDLWPRIALVVMALVVLVGSFLPWASEGVLGIVTTGVSTTSFIFEALVVLGFAITALFVPAKWARITAGVLGIVMSSIIALSCIGLLAGKSLIEETSLLPELSSLLEMPSLAEMSTSITLGAGYYVTMAASVGMLAFSIITLAKKNPAEPKKAGADKVAAGAGKESGEAKTAGAKADKKA